MKAPDSRQKSTLNKKKIALVLVGNILDYYDFMLFAHLGFIITPLFIPNLSSIQSHLVSLLLFGLPFVIRPLGGYVFGRISDLNGRGAALTESIKWSAVATFGFALLPINHNGDLLLAYLFVFFRLLQGLSLGGEYPTAGTYLMEEYPNNQGLLSGILCASGTIGSLGAFFFAWIVLKGDAPEWVWRIAFLFGGICSFISYYLRKKLSSTNSKILKTKKLEFSPKIGRRKPIILTLMIGILVGLTTWLPMMYSNFYLTKILNYRPLSGLFATFIALISYVVLTPFFGYISDRTSKMLFMSVCAFLSIPLGCIGFWLMTEGYVFWGQILLIIPAASFGAPIHVVMNDLFPGRYRSRYINSLFMLGLGFGGLGPSISGFIMNTLGWSFFPPIFMSTAALIVGFMLLLNDEKKILV